MFGAARTRLKAIWKLCSYYLEITLYKTERWSRIVCSPGAGKHSKAISAVAAAFRVGLLLFIDSQERQRHNLAFYPPPFLDAFLKKAIEHQRCFIQTTAAL